MLDGVSGGMEGRGVEEESFFFSGSTASDDEDDDQKKRDEFDGEDSVTNIDGKFCLVRNPAKAAAAPPPPPETT